MALISFPFVRVLFHESVRTWSISSMFAEPARREKQELQLLDMEKGFGKRIFLEILKFDSSAKSWKESSRVRG